MSTEKKKKETTKVLKKLRGGNLIEIDPQIKRWQMLRRKGKIEKFTVNQLRPQPLARNYLKGMRTNPKKNLFSREDD